MLKHYGPRHWGLFVPVWFKKNRKVWDWAMDAPIERPVQSCFCITVKFDRLISALPFYEIRVRVGAHYL